jgi:hypothetical protein
MKKDNLKDYIKSRIREVLYAGPGAIAKAKTNPNYAKLKDRAQVDTALRTGGSVELEEMARKAITFKIAPDYKEKAATIKTGGPISPKKLEDIIAFLDGKETTTGPEIATGVGFEGKMPRIYPIFAALIDKGALVSTAETETVDVPDTPENTGDGAEEFFRFDGEEETTTGEEEPQETDIEKVDVTLDPVAKAASDFTMDNDRLIQSIINLYKDSRVRVKEIREEEGDLSAADYRKALSQSKDSAVKSLADKVDQLVNKIKDLEPAAQDKVLSNLDFSFKSVDAGYLSKLIYKKLDRQAPTTEPEKDTVDVDIEDIDDEEITEDSGVEDVDYEGSNFKDYDSIYERMQKLIKYKG